jgi:colanic acid/amylovoran biosynthesis glycosyltransferase
VVHRSNIIIYRDQLLPYSETFIPAQVENCKFYQGVYVGSSRLPNLSPHFPQDRCITLDTHRPFPGLWKTLYKLVGYPHPQWLDLLKAHSPHLIHAHFGLDGVLALPLAKYLKIPLIVTFHGYYATTEPDAAFKVQNPLYWLDYINQRGRFFRHLYFRRQQVLFQQATCVIAVSQHIRKSLIQKGCPPSKIQVHYIGVDVEQFQPDSGMVRQPYVLFVGRLVEKKGCEYLIRAMAQVQTQQPEAELVIIGDGPLRRSLETLAAQQLLRYRFEGKQPPNLVKAWMGRSRVLVAPSVTTAQGETEGLPIVVLEAMAMGLPVVGSIHAGIPEAVVSNENGFLVAEQDGDGLSQCILTLLQDQPLWDRFAMAGRQRVETHFNLQTNTRSLEALYTQVLAEAGEN